MLGLAYYEADKCPGCGRSLTETTTAELEQWHVTQHVCTACEALSAKQKSLDPKNHKHPSAYLWTVERDGT